MNSVILARKAKFNSRTALSLLLSASLLTSLGACSDGDPGRAPAVATAVVPTGSALDACQLLTRDDVALATGWKTPIAHPVDTGAEFVTSCSFADGDDLARVATVTVSTGGATHQSAAEFAQSVGDNGGMLTKPASAVEGFPVPVIAISLLGGMHGMQARTPAAVELTVVTWSTDTTSKLFPKALSRLLETKAS